MLSCPNINDLFNDISCQIKNINNNIDRVNNEVNEVKIQMDRVNKTLSSILVVQPTQQPSDLIELYSHYDKDFVFSQRKSDGVYIITGKDVVPEVMENYGGVKNSKDQYEFRTDIYNSTLDDILYECGIEF